MDVFISWSGERSRATAEALRGWLPKIINALKPWLSSADIDKGARWGTDVASRLETAKASIICLTPSNLHSDWILFEAGALSKTLQNTFVCPFLIGLEPSDIKQPLAQFQATRAVKGDVLKLLKTLNKAIGNLALDDEHIKEVFEVWWPKLESQLTKLPKDEVTGETRRSDRELLEEVLSLLRSQARENTPQKESRGSQQRTSRRMSLRTRVRESAIKQKFAEALAASGKSIKEYDLSPDKEGNYFPVYELTDGETYGFIVPEEISEADLPDFIKEQVEDQFESK
jgi:hypothetical protein